MGGGRDETAAAPSKCVPAEQGLRRPVAPRSVLRGPSLHLETVLARHGRHSATAGLSSGRPLLFEGETSCQLNSAWSRMRPLLSHGVDPVAPSGSVADPVLKSRPQGNSRGCMSDQSIQLTFQNSADQWAYPSIQMTPRVPEIRLLEWCARNRAETFLPAGVPICTPATRHG